MEKEFVPYDIALAMKELGFNGKTICYYTDDEKLWQMGIPLTPDNEPVYGLFTPNIGDNVRFVAAPLYQQAFRWFREKLKESAIEPYDMVKHYSYNMKVSWEEAQEACLRKLIEIVRNGK